MAGGKREIESLAAADHSLAGYEEFNKDFYTAAPEVAAMPEAEVRPGGGGPGNAAPLQPLQLLHCRDGAP